MRSDDGGLEFRIQHNFNRNYLHFKSKRSISDAMFME